MKEWEIWFAKFPYEEDPKIEKSRPVIVLNIDPLEVLSVKITGQNVRDDDNYDTPIINWKSAGLKAPSVARVSKTINLTKEKFQNKLGCLHIDDQKVISEQFMKYINEHK